MVLSTSLTMAILLDVVVVANLGPAVVVPMVSVNRRTRLVHDFLSLEVVGAGRVQHDPLDVSHCKP